MRRACALAAGLIVLMGTLPLDPAVRPAVWAQAPAVREGLYTLTRRETKVPPDDWSPASLPGHMRILQLLPGNVYMWGEGDQAFYSDYRVGFRDTPQGRITTISLCHRFAGDVVPAWHAGSPSWSTVAMARCPGSHVKCQDLPPCPPTGSRT